MTSQLITLPVRLYARGARLLLHAAEDVTGKAVMSTLRVAGALGNLRPGSGGAASTPTRPSPPTQDRPSPQPDPRSAATRRPAPNPTNGSAAATRTRPAKPKTRPAKPKTQAAEPETQAAEPETQAAEPETQAAEPETQAAEPEASAPEAGNGAPPTLASERLEKEGRTSSIDLDALAPAEPDHVSAEPVLVREEAEPGAEDGAGAAIRVDEPWEGYGRMAARDIVGRLAAASSAELAAVQLYESAHRKRQTVLATVQRELAKPGR